MTFIPPPENIKSLGNCSTANVGGRTTVNENFVVGDTNLTVANGNVFDNNTSIRIDDEYLIITNIEGNNLTVVRGAFDSTVANHSNGAQVIGVYIGVKHLSTLADVMVSLKSSTNGSEHFDFSNDGVTWDTFPLTGFIVNANVHEFHTAVKGRRYFRIRFENGSSSKTTSFRVDTHFGSFRQGNLPLNQSITDDSDSTIVRSVNVGKNPQNVYKNSRVSGYVFMTDVPMGADGVYDTIIDSPSEFISCAEFSQIQAELYSDVSGVLVGYWYSDSLGTKLVRTFTRPYNASSGNAYFSSPVFAPYVRYVYTNGDVEQTEFYLGMRLLVEPISGQIIGLTDYIPTNIVANMGRNVIAGQKPNGLFDNVNIDHQSHIEVAIHGPLLPSGSVHTENVTPILQYDGTYNINSLNFVTTTQFTGSVISSNSEFVCSTGTNNLGSSTIQSVKRLRYRPGQGYLLKFTGKYTANNPSGAYQIMGMGHSEDGYYFGYKNSNFGILHINRAYREIRVLTITNGATSNAVNVSITLNGVVFSSLVLSNYNNIGKTAWQISQLNFTGWTTEQITSGGATKVIFMANSSGNKNGTYSFSAGSSGAVATFSRLRQGTDGTETFIPQTSWNLDKMNGDMSLNNPSAVNLDPSKYNVYCIGLNYSGIGSIIFQILADPPNFENSPNWTTVHIIKTPNSLSSTPVGNPSFPFTMSAYKTTNNITDISVYCASIIGGIEGKIIRHGPRLSYRAIADVSNTKGAVLLIKNSILFNNIPNQSVINLKNLVASANSSASGITTVYLIKNPTINITSDNIDFIPYADGVSCSLYHVTPQNNLIPLTYTNDKIIYSASISADGQIVQDFDTDGEEITLQPNDILAVELEATANTTVIVSINTREDQ
jgi:hypothetical protein